MEKGKFRSLMMVGLLSLLLLILTSCGGGFAGNETVPVAADVVNTTMNYVDGPEVGPVYDVTIQVPQEWVGNFELRNIGNRLYFDYTNTADGETAQIFFIEALSNSQFWMQSGSFPGSYANIVNKGDTYFIYHLPVDAYYSGLSEDEFVTFSSAVPEVIATFMVEAQ